MLIRNGTIVDGTGGPRYRADLLIDEGTILAIGRNLSADGYEVVDASGLIIAPGFIDTHSHSDLKVLEDPLLAPKLRQGITTEVLGQDGISMAPLPLAYVEDWKKNLAGLEGVSDTVDWSWKTTEGYLAALEARGLVLNESYLVPHGNVRMEAMGLEDRAPTIEEVDAMTRIVRREMEAGALGLSSGLIYIPCAYGDVAEIIAMCRVVAEFGGVFVVHQRSEANNILASMDEILRIGRESGVRLHFSHFKICGRKNWPKFDAVLAKLDAARAEGLSVTFDQYPYTAGSTMLGAILPAWAHAGGTNRLLGRLLDPDARRRMTADILAEDCDWDNFVEFAGLDGISVTSVKTSANADAVGLSLVELGERRGKPPLEAAFDLLLEEENAVGMIDVYGSEDQVKALIRRPEMNLCTDGLLGGRPHPRVYGSFPKLLRYVREENLVTLEEAVRKMTGQPAAVFGFEDRGTVTIGKAADLVLFDPSTVGDTGTYADPARFPDGIHRVIVGGKTVWDGHRLDEAGFPGRVLRGRR
jgi:N-acyl-D-amino-acid deacylase